MFLVSMLLIPVPREAGKKYKRESLERKDRRNVPGSMLLIPLVRRQGRI